ncbi:MAG: ATP-binding protein [Lachnospiraceae bacterium]|nr:ATP-binding protein [Lachnospiraceae bacterium]
MKKRVADNNMIGRLFFGMLPVQILIFAMGGVNSIVDGAMAGRFIGSSAVGVVGLYYPMVNIITAAGSVLLGGSTVICGRFMGRGDVEKTERVFSLDLSLAFIIGAVIAIGSLLFSGPLAALLGANAELKDDLVRYITGYAIGIIPMLLAQQISSFLQLERQDRRGYIGIGGMTVANIVLDTVLVAYLGMGLLGLALATAFSNTIYFLITVPYYFTDKAQLHFGIKKINWRQTSELVMTGLPGALLVFCIAINGIAINHLLLKYAGDDGLSAMSAFNMIRAILIAYCLGNGNAVRMLVSVFAGEEDRGAICRLFRILATKALALSAAVTIVVLLLSSTLAGIFFPDRSSDVYALAHQLFVIYAFCIPLILICQVNTNYLQAMGHSLFVDFQSVFDGLFSNLIPSAILAPVFGAFGIWIANPIGIILTILTVPVYRIIWLRRFPRTHDDFMFFAPDFGAEPENTLFIHIHDNDELSLASSRIQEFCEGHEMDKRASYYSALCVEELAGNVIRHGFTADRKTHSLNVLAIRKKNGVTIRIKDDCKPFDIREMADMVRKQEDRYANIGIRMVYSIADGIDYMNLLGLNIISIKIHDRDLIRLTKTDYLLEKSLAEQDPDLHRRFADTVFIVRKILSRYRLLFPEYTDHSELHSLTVVDSCNRLIGSENINRLNADEIYILLEAAYLHDAGMGISERDYAAFKDRFNESEYFRAHPDDTAADFVREYHNEFSGAFIEKYAGLFDFPTKEHTFAIRQVARGHRRTDLFDEKEYPSDYHLPNGNTVCLPYLSAIIRLADEIDVVASRNPLVLYDIGMLTDEREIVENKKLAAVKEMKMTSDEFILTAETGEKDIAESLENMVVKMQKTLDQCSRVISERTKYTLSQKRVKLDLSFAVDKERKSM